MDTINKKIKYLSLSVFVLLVGVFTSHRYALDSNLAFKNADGYGKYTQEGVTAKSILLTHWKIILKTQQREHLDTP
ncbi:hypothetical protein [Pseudoalteromonas sp. B62]|uniref:hypothetical protein n=1 Tax=Pseudoalteromonas sp. B62 TaxID=630483 RepID=UPI00301E501C